MTANCKHGDAGKSRSRLGFCWIASVRHSRPALQASTAGELVDLAAEAAALLGAPLSLFVVRPRPTELIPINRDGCQRLGWDGERLLVS